MKTTNVWLLGISLLMAASAFASSTPEEYSIALERPNGYRIPKIMGATGDVSLDTGYDYFDWYGITEYRNWFKPAFSKLADNSRITTPEAFAEASEAIRKDPMRQATSSNYFIDWAHFYKEQANARMPETMRHLKERDIMPMIINTRQLLDVPLTDDWVNTFKFWKYWYAMVYHYGSKHDVTLYEFSNESHARGVYERWESHWLVAADAMQKAMEDVNADFGKNLTLRICGPTCAGIYWNEHLTKPAEDAHGWGSLSWKKVKTDIYGNYSASNPWNYGMYDYHRYGQDAETTQEMMLKARTDIANAKNDPSPDIPLVITEYNTSTGGNFDRRKLDTEDLYFGVSMAQILEAYAASGPAGLGDEGGIFIFKLGGRQSRGPFVGVGNKLSYVSQIKPHNYGGVTRGGACFQLFARHFRGGKPLVPVSVVSGGHERRRTIAAVDEEKQTYYVYGSNCSGDTVSVSIDLNALKVEGETVVGLHRVDENNTGQVTEILKLDNFKRLRFEAPNNTAYLIKVPMTKSLTSYRSIDPTEDATQSVQGDDIHGSAPIMAVSNHHSDAAQRHAGMMRFRIDGANTAGRAFLKLSGRNHAKDPSAREILHVYAVKDEIWSENATMTWTDAPGLGQYYVGDKKIGVTDGTGGMVDIEDNYAGVTDGVGKGLGLGGEFVGAVSFHSSEYVTNYLDVTDTLKSMSEKGASLDVTFVIVRIVRYNVHEYENSYYTLGDYHYDGRMVQIATKEAADQGLRPKLIIALEN
ncbi:MAG: CBM96 family carbohydrate-binding protein [Opitutaceae bacterium]